MNKRQWTLLPSAGACLFLPLAVIATEPNVQSYAEQSAKE